MKNNFKRLIDETLNEKKELSLKEIEADLKSNIKGAAWSVKKVNKPPFGDLPAIAVTLKVGGKKHIGYVDEEGYMWTQNPNGKYASDEKFKKPIDITKKLQQRAKSD